LNKLGDVAMAQGNLPEAYRLFREYLTVAQRLADAQRFFALVPAPSPSGPIAPVVTYILTGRAHNRSATTVDMRAAAR
jgi:hypothetical protein